MAYFGSASQSVHTKNKFMLFPEEVQKNNSIVSLEVPAARVSRERAN
jgi:hypothetical protein